jgi:hypothetical protein
MSGCSAVAAYWTGLKQSPWHDGCEHAHGGPAANQQHSGQEILVVGLMLLALDHPLGRGNRVDETSHLKSPGLAIMVSSAHRTAILAATQQEPALQRNRWFFPEVASWLLRQGKEPVWERTYNLLWQRGVPGCPSGARPAAVRSRASSDGGVCAPTFLRALGVPVIVGLVGGGETSPGKLRDRFPPRGRVLEGLRDLSNATIELNPIAGPGPAQRRRAIEV